MKIEYPLLEALKKHGSHFNANQMLSLPSDSDFGNLVVSWHEIVIRIDCVNDQVIHLYDKFYEAKEIMKSQGYYEQNLNEGYRNGIMLIEQIFYWLRKSSDEIISIISILSDFKKSNVYPKQIKESSIGEFLKSKNEKFSSVEKYRDLLHTLNEISNCYKHSFTNSQISAYKGSEYPVAFAYNLQYNNLKSQPKFISIDLGKFLIDYDNFLREMKLHIESNFI